MTELLSTDAKNILNLLLLHLSTHRSRILSGVRMLAKMEKNMSESKERGENIEERIVRRKL